MSTLMIIVAIIFIVANGISLYIVKTNYRGYNDSLIEYAKNLTPDELTNIMDVWLHDRLPKYEITAIIIFLLFIIALL